jgi:hypothetical protein
VKKTLMLIAAVTALAAATGAAVGSGALRHAALPLLSDPSADPPPAAAPPEPLDSCTADDIARVPARVTVLLPRRDGKLWIGTFDRGVLVLDAAGRTRAHPGLDGREAFVNALVDDGDGVWVGTQRGAVRFHGGRRAAVALAGDPVTAFARAEGALLAGGPRGLSRITTSGRAAPVPFEGGAPRVNALARAGADLYVGTPEGVLVVPVSALAGPAPVRARRILPVFGSPAALTDVVTALAPLGATVVAGTDDGGLVLATRYGPPRGHRFPPGRENLVNPGAAAESGGIAAFGTQGGGMLLVADAGAGRLAVTRAAVTAGWSVSAVAEAPGGGWLAGLDDGRVVRVACPGDREPEARSPATPPGHHGSFWSFSFSRSAVFRNFPVAVRGIWSMNTYASGSQKRANLGSR